MAVLSLWITPFLLLAAIVLIADAGRKDKKKKIKIIDGKPWPLNPSLQRSAAPQTRAMAVDRDFALRSWNTFQRLSQINERKDREERRKRKLRRQYRTFNNSPKGAIGPPGPRGPPGPPGPRGPKGANVTKEEILEDVRTMFREFSARNLIGASDPRCTQLCVSTLEANETGPVLQDPMFSDSHELLVSKMVTAFMWELKDFTTVPKKSLVELDSFVKSFRPGGYEHGVGNSKAISGRFFVTRTGYYMFFIRTHLLLPKSENGGNVPTRDDLFSVLLCIEALCRENLNLETISGFGPGQKMTVSINGMLYLETGQYVSVFIDNNSRYPVNVFEGSQFSGHLAGL